MRSRVRRLSGVGSGAARVERGRRRRARRADERCIMGCRWVGVLGEGGLGKMGVEGMCLVGRCWLESDVNDCGGLSPRQACRYGCWRGESAGAMLRRGFLRE